MPIIWTSIAAAVAPINTDISVFIPLPRNIDESDKKLFSKKKLLEGLQGVLFPVGAMFEEDNTMLNAMSMNRLLNSNYISIAYTIQRLRKCLVNKEKFTITGFGSVSSFLGRRINSVYAGAKRALESYFESLAFDQNFKNINIQSISPNIVR